MAANAQVIAGAFLLFIGGLLALNVFSLATVIYPERFWYSLFPGGSSADPTVLTPGSAVTLSAQLIYYDAQTGVQIPGTYLTWTVQVTIPETGQTITLDAKGVVSSIENRYAAFLFEKPWTAPSKEGQSLTFNWLAIIRDNNYNEVGRVTCTTYAKTTPPEAPDGYFMLNGVRADVQSTHVITSPSLAVSFTATKGGDKITSVYVEVYRGGSRIDTVTLSGSNPNWQASYTLPAAGTYTLKGYFKWTGDANPVQKMSIVVGWGEQELPETPMKLSQVAGVGMAALGAGLIYTGRRNRR